MTAWLEGNDTEGGAFRWNGFLVAIAPGAYHWRAWIETDPPTKGLFVITPHVFATPEDAARWARSFILSDDFYWEMGWGQRPTRDREVFGTAFWYRMRPEAPGEGPPDPSTNR